MGYGKNLYCVVSNVLLLFTKNFSQEVSSKKFEPVGVVLQSWFEENSHKRDLPKLCESMKLNIESVKSCVAGLYDKSCKGWHGYDHYVVIYEKYWNRKEVVALMFMFNYFHISYRYIYFDPDLNLT